MKLPQIVAAGIFNSGDQIKNRVISKNRKTTMFEIEIPLEEGGISYIDTNFMPITPNMLICVKPGQTRHTRLPFVCYYIHMIVYEGPLYDILMETPDFFETEKWEEYREIFARIRKHYINPARSEELMLQSLVLELVYKIGKENAKRIKERSSANSLLIDNAIDYVKTHLTEDLSLEAVSKIMSLSPIHFHNTFKAATGKTLREFVEEQRIKKAANLLITTNDSLTKIAFECGFSSQSYFSYTFKRRMKKTPREYTKEIFSKYEI